MPRWDGTDSQTPFRVTAFGTLEVAGEEVVAARGIDHAATALPRRVERLLKGRRVVGLAVALGAEIADGVRVSIRRSAGCRRQQEAPGQYDGSQPTPVVCVPARTLRADARIALPHRSVCVPACSARALVGRSQLAQVHLHQRAVVGHQAVDLDLDIGGLRVNGGGQALLADERKQLVNQINVGRGERLGVGDSCGSPSSSRFARCGLARAGQGRQIRRAPTRDSPPAPASPGPGYLCMSLMSPTPRSLQPLVLTTSRVGSSFLTISVMRAVSHWPQPSLYGTHDHDAGMIAASLDRAR